LKAKCLLVFLVLALSSPAVSAEAVRNLSLPAAGIEALQVDCGAGFLHVFGDDTLENIEVEAEIIVGGKDIRDMDAFIRDKVKLGLEKRGGRAVLVSRFKTSFSLFRFGNRVINLTVRMPRRMELAVDDGSGEIRIESLEGTLRIDDGSGDIFIRDIQGDVTVNDGSGGIEVTDVQGSVDIDDGSGGIRVRSVGRNVSLSDGSGSISVDGVEGDVIIRDDGSGSVRLVNVKGRVVR